MEVKIVNTSEELAALQEPWERLEQQDPDVTFYSTFLCVKAWWDAFSTKPGVSLHIVCVYQNQDLAGIGPFAVVTEKKGFLEQRVLQFAGRGDYLNVLTDRALNPDTVIKYMFAALTEKPEWDVVRLSGIPAQSQLAGYLLKSGDNEYFRHQIENPYADLRGYASFDQYKQQNLPGKVVKLRNKLQREEGFEFAAVPNNQGDIFARIARLHREEKQFLVAQMGRGYRHSLYEDPHISGYVQNIFDRADNVLTFLYQDSAGGLLGYKTCYLYKGTALSWNGGYNPRYFQYSIGKILYYDILDHVLTNRLADVFDWGAGRYPWKFEWTSTFTMTYRLEKPITRKGKGLLRARALVHAVKQ